MLPTNGMLVRLFQFILFPSFCFGDHLIEMQCASYTFKAPDFGLCRIPKVVYVIATNETDDELDYDAHDEKQWNTLNTTRMCH